MNCEDIKLHFFDYLTQRLDDELHKKVESHLKACKACQKELEELRRLLRLLDIAKPPRLPEDFAEKVMERIETEFPTKESLRQRWLNAVSHFLRPIPTLATAVIILVILIVYQNIYSPKKEVIPRKIEITTLNPIKLTTDNISISLSHLKDLISSFDGKIIKEEGVNSGIKLTVYLPQEKESSFLNALKSIGEVQIKGNYRDKNGRIIILLLSNKKRNA